MISNYILTSKTQVGKTGKILDIIEESKRETLVVITCTNKKDQLEQLVDRMKGRSINFITSDKFSSKINFNDKVVIVILNNKCQRNKLDKFVKANIKSKNKYLVIHDEADTVTKAVSKENAEAVLNSKEVLQTEANAKANANFWENHFKNIRSCKIIVLNVSATPENCSLSGSKNVKCKNVYVINPKKEYVGDIVFENWSFEDNSQIISEVNRINESKSNEVILYCASRLNNDHEELSIQLSEDCNCPVLTYNGKGICLYINGESNYKSISSISEVLGEIENGGAVIVVGHNLLDRGISFVSNKKKKPLSATIMFYAASESIYAVSIVQRIGRITGSSRPDLPTRKVYCRKEIFDCYNNYLENQKRLYSSFRKKENKDKLVRDVIEENNLNLLEIKRNLDRPELKAVNKTYKRCLSKKKIEGLTTEASEAEASEAEAAKDAAAAKTEKLIRSWSREDNENVIALVFRKMVKVSGFKLKSLELKEFINTIYTDKNGAFFNNMHNKNHISKWYLVFELKNKYLCIREEAKIVYKTIFTSV